MIQEIANALVQSWRNFATAFVLFVPRLVAATIIFAGGFVVSLLVRRAIQRLLAWLGADRLSLRTGASEMLRKADMPTAEALIAKIVFWIVWIGFIVSAVDTLQFEPFQGLVDEFFRFVPRFLVALLVLSLGFLVGNFLWRATLLASVNAGLPGARLLSGALRVLVIAIGVVMALEQLGLATAVVLTAFAITFGALMLGLAIAFGLGGRDAAKQLLEQQLQAKRRARRGRRASLVIGRTMSFPRSSGVLLHPTSLPGGFGIGDLGPSAFEFIDLLASAGQRLWQVLPLGPTGYGDSPYQCFSAFAGNTLLVSLERLIEDGLLTESEAGDRHVFQPGNVDFPAVIAHRRALWPRVLDRFDAAGGTPMRDRFDRFCRAHASWLDDFALFMAVKEAHGHVAWTAWEPDIAQRDPSAMARWSARCAREIRLHKLTQFLFFEQWQRVRDACRARSIEIMGDLPIFVAHDSADVWAHRELFRLDCRRPPDRAHRCAAGLLQRDRPVVGESPLPVGCPRADRIRLVDRALSCPAGAGRSRPHRSLPRIRGVVGSAARRDDGHSRRVGERAGRVALRSGAISAGSGSAALRGREPRRDHAGSGSAARAVAASRDGHPPVCLWKRPAGPRFQASQLPTEPCRLHRHSRQRHDRGVVDRWSRPQYPVGHRARERA